MTNSKIDFRERAANLARQGFLVFPLQANEKKPPAGSWLERVCNTPEKASTMWSRPEFREANIGIHCTGMAVVDVDEGKKPGALAAYRAMGLPPTFSVRTPSGGYHFYFFGANVGNGVDRSSPGIDIRGHHGYVVAPGSITAAGRYEVLDDVPLADAPANLLAICSPPGASVNRGGVDWNTSGTPASRIDDARHWLATDAPVSVEGAGGNATGYKVAAALHDRGVYAQDALSLLLEVWNDRCQPPWSHCELEQLVTSGFTYSQNEFGCRAPDVMYSSVDVPEAAAPLFDEPPKLTRLAATNLADLDQLPIPERRWFIEGLIPAGNVTLLYGDGATGKSLLALQLAASAVTGQDWIGKPLCVEPGPAIYLSAEDDLAEHHARATKIAAGMGVTLRELDGLHVVDLANDDATLARFDRDETMIATPLWARLEMTVDEIRPRLVVVDNLADVFGGNEISKSQSRQFVKLLRRLPGQYGCTVLTLAHPSQNGMALGTGTSGNVAWSNSVRSRLYLKPAPALMVGQKADPDVKQLELMKANYGKAGGAARIRWRDWFFTPEGVSTEQIIEAEEDAAQEAFMVALADFRAQGRDVSAATGRSYAPLEFSSHSACRGRFGKATLALAMGALFEVGRIAVEELGPPSKRRKRIVIADPAKRAQVPAEMFDGPSSAALATALHDVLLRRDGVSATDAFDAAKALCAADPHLAAMGAGAVKTLLESRFGPSPVAVPNEDLCVRYKREQEGARPRHLIVIE